MELSANFLSPLPLLWIICSQTAMYRATHICSELVTDISTNSDIIFLHRTHLYYSATSYDFYVPYQIASNTSHPVKVSRLINFSFCVEYISSNEYSNALLCDHIFLCHRLDRQLHFSSSN
jgi:hypothetical protein